MGVSDAPTISETVDETLQGVCDALFSYHHILSGATAWHKDVAERIHRLSTPVTEDQLLRAER